MTLPPAVRTLGKRALPALALAVVAALVAAPAAFGSSGGMNSDNPLFPADFDERGCTSCHGGADHLWAVGADKVQVSILDEGGDSVHAGQYANGATYTIVVNLTDEVAPDAANHAGFYLKATAGEFHASDDANIQITGGGLEASHTDASATSWTVEWTAPESGAVAFTLMVNDVDGSGNADEGDQAYRRFFALTDEQGAQLGAAEEHDVHYGVSLQQYWIGLIAVVGMLFIMLGGYVYLKYVNPHNTSPKDR